MGGHALTPLGGLTPPPLAQKVGRAREGDGGEATGFAKALEQAAAAVKRPPAGEGGPSGTAGASPTPAEQRLASLSELDRKRLQQAAGDFEAMFLRQMFAAMRKTAPQGGFLPTSQGEEVFRDMLDGEYAKLGSQGGGGLGLKDVLLRQLVGQAAPPAAVEPRATSPTGPTDAGGTTGS